MKALLPTLKEKKRYLLYEVLMHGETGKRECELAVLQSMQFYVGVLGMAKAGIMFLPDWDGKKGIVRVSNTHIMHLKAALAMVESVDAKEATMRSAAVSGILNKLRGEIHGKTRTHGV